MSGSELKCCSFGGILGGRNGGVAENPVSHVMGQGPDRAISAGTNAKVTPPNSFTPLGSAANRIQQRRYLQAKQLDSTAHEIIWSWFSANGRVKLMKSQIALKSWMDSTEL